MSDEAPRLPLFAGVGVELEYMIVDAETLNVRPICDELIRAITGNYQSDVERGKFCWSNELVSHVVELKTNGPATSLSGLAAGFHREVKEVNRRLTKLGARLMPTAMHPWMDPHAETRLWPHEYSPVYEAYNRIFGCQGHGWSNLQSMHLNLPFANDAEFGALHAAIRALLPILPALAASSPVIDGKPGGWLDNRLRVYRSNSAKIPSITGRVIPEAVFSEEDYDREILQRMYHDIAPHDPEGILQDEFLNSRGAIARFGRGSIEIRVLDIQECPQADLAIAQVIVQSLRALVQERWQSLDYLKRLETEALERIFLTTSELAETAQIDDHSYLESFGLRSAKPVCARDVWRHLLSERSIAAGIDRAGIQNLHAILENGTLARRILRRLDGKVTADQLRATFGGLSDCLASGRMFVA